MEFGQFRICLNGSKCYVDLIKDHKVNKFVRCPSSDQA